MLKVYHNPRCRNSRAGVEFLKANGGDFTLVNYFKEPFTEESLKRLLMKLNKKPEEIIRKHEEIYKSRFKGKEFTNDEWIKILIEFPRLIKRPIIEREHKAVIGDPLENIISII